MVLGAARWLLTLLLALALAGGVVVLVGDLRDDRATLPQGPTPLAAGARAGEPETTRAALLVATAGAEQIVGYSADTLDDDVAASLPLMAPSMQERYRASIERRRGDIVDRHEQVRATVVAVSSVSVTSTDAVALLFVNRSTSDDTSTKPREDLNRVVVTLHHDDAGWLVTALDAV